MVKSPGGNTARSAAGMRTFLNIAQRWKLTKHEALTLLKEGDPKQWDAWRAGRTGGLSVEQIKRLSLALGIYQCLHTLLPIPERADAWIRQPNTATLFGGATALELMMSDAFGDIESVKKYLDTQLR